MKRAIIVVLDSLGVGALPDAEAFGDLGADTLGHIVRECRPNIPNLLRLGLGNIDGAAEGKLRVAKPEGLHFKCLERSKGKDTITGHWEIAGIETKVPFKSYPNGFPSELMDAFVKATGREYIGNYPASGTEIIERLGPEHEATGKVIVYTSADSVFQVAANTDVVPLNELYEICAKARELLVDEFACGRVIARPYVIDEEGRRKRTSDRRDYSVAPPMATMLDHVKGDGQTVCAIGKISDIYNGRGVTESIHTEDNDDGITKTIEAINRDFNGLIFTNLVDFDSKYGHRRDAAGYAKALEEFDYRLPEIEGAMKEDDILILCSDHGNDPVHQGTDHTREYIFGIVTGEKIKAGKNLGIRSSFADIGATVTDYLTEGRFKTSIGISFKEEIE